LFLQHKVAEHEAEIEDLKRQLANSETLLKKSNDECSKLVVTLRSAGVMFIIFKLGATSIVNP